MADHQAQRQRRHHHHAGGSAQSAQKRQHSHRVLATRQRQRQHVEVRRHPLSREGRATGFGQRQDRQRDQHHVQRKQPARSAHMTRVAAFDDADVELVRQGEHRQRTHQHQRRKPRGIARFGGERADDVGRVQHHQPDHQQRQQLEGRIEGHRQHQAAVVADRRRPSRTEQHGEQRHRQRHVKRAVVPRRHPGVAARPEHGEAHGHRLQLQRQVRHRAHHGDRGHQRGQAGVMAQPAGDQVGDRTGVGLARQPHHPHQQAGGKRIEQDGADEGRRQPPARAHRLRDRAVERPRRAVHRQRQRIDDRPRPAQRARVALAVARDRKQRAQPQQTGKGDPQI